ncbi:MAG: matrixin family metalloprotease [Myxococcota bacterium]
MMRRAAALLIPVIALLLATPIESVAYERTKTCGTYGVRDCRDGEVALPLYWRSPCVEYKVNEDGTSQVESDGIADTTYEAIRASFNAWNNVECSELQMVDGGTTSVTAAEGPPTGDNERLSLVVFRDSDWGTVPGASARSYALTSVSYLPDTGQILDADIEINSDTYDLNILGEPRDMQADLVNTLTHEVGHFLGLAHSFESEATMYSQAPLGETDKRSLEQDDIDGICDAYGFEGEPAICEDPEDFSQDRPSNDDDKKGCCTTSVDGTLPPSTGLIFAVGLLLTARLRRRAPSARRL